MKANPNCYKVKILRHKKSKPILTNNLKKMTKIERDA